MDPCLTFSSILHSIHLEQPMFTTFLLMYPTSCHGFETAFGLPGCHSAKLFGKAACWGGLVVSSRKVAASCCWEVKWEDFLQNSQSCTFLFLTEIAEEEGVWGGGQARSCWLAITRCPCARALPLPRPGGMQHILHGFYFLKLCCTETTICSLKTTPIF